MDPTLKSILTEKEIECIKKSVHLNIDINKPIKDLTVKEMCRIGWILTYGFYN